MRGKSHICLGKYLAERYLSESPRPCVQAFLIGCLEPDRNPLTYLKGSFRCQWLRGHNYRNARRFMRRISMRLEEKSRWNLLDYYTLGKLIHYTADAFTYAHNDNFPVALSSHREYENALQEHFLAFLEEDPQINITMARSVMEAISSCHRSYEKQSANIFTDSRFALNACCCVLAILLVKPVLQP